MDKLPPEILNRIFIQLDLKQRLVCLTICRSWWRVLDEYCLFYNIDINNRDDQFDRMMDMFVRLPDRAAQVVEFFVDLHGLGENPNFNRRRLLQVFPNARKLEFQRDWGCMNSDHTPTEHIDLTHSNSKVECLADYDDCELISQMVYSNLGGRLEKRVLHLPGEGSSTIVCQLKDLPVLKMLMLREADLALDDLELLHMNVPSIQNLTYDTLFIDEGSMPSEIVPATSVTTLKYLEPSPGNIETLCLAYKYFTKKYPNITDGEFDHVDFREHDVSDIKHFYLNGYLDFLKFIGPTRCEIALNYTPDGINPFEALNAVDSKIQRFNIRNIESVTLLPDFFQSNQSKYAQVLTLCDTKINSIHLIKNMVCLTQLDIRYHDDDPPFDLVDFLAACPSSLKRLTIDCHHLVVKPSNITLESIETLNIHCHTLTSELGDIISSCFPNLVTLRLDYKDVQSTNIILNSPRFQRGTLHRDNLFSTNDVKYGLSFKSPAQPETEYYICNDNKKRKVQYDEGIEGLPIVLVESLTEKKLDVDYNIEVIPCQGLLSFFKDKSFRMQIIELQKSMGL